MDTIELTREQLERYLDYSCSLPTGTTIGKQWRRRVDYYDESKGWYILEYVESNSPYLVGIKWLKVILDEDMPLMWEGD